jgi:hypothetical protein
MPGSWREPMSGYTPVFKSVFTGSLTGKWPDTGLWVSLLALADKNGELDYTPQYISMVTGLDLKEVEDCLQRFTQPDPMSRSGTDEGRRLVLTDPNRFWGWRIVNFVAYREKARLSAKNAREVEEGRNRDRLAARNDLTAADRRSPPVTAADPLSNANANTVKEDVKRPSRRVPPDFQPDESYALAELPDMDVVREVQKFRDCEFSKPRKDWPAVWRTWVGTCRDSGRYAKRSNGKSDPYARAI